jgi:hypothetical protein
MAFLLFLLLVRIFYLIKVILPSFLLFFLSSIPKHISSRRTQKLRHTEPYILAALTFTNSTPSPHSIFIYFVRISEQTAIISTYKINWLIFIIETDCVFCEVPPQLLYTIYINFKLQTINASPTSSILQQGILQYKSLYTKRIRNFRWPTGCILPSNETQLPCIRKRRGRKQTKRAERRIEEGIGERECPLKIPFLIILIIQWNIKGRSWAAQWLLCLDWLIP